jgi:hypothetical protein
MIGSMWYRLGPEVGMRKVGGDGECMGWSGVWVEVVDEVRNGTLAGSTCIGDVAGYAYAISDMNKSQETSPKPQL